MPYVSTVMAAPYLLRVQIGPQGQAGDVTRIASPRPFKNADAIRSRGANQLLIFESDAFGDGGPYGGAVTLAKLDGERIDQLTPVVSGLAAPSSGALFGDRVYFIESKYGLLFAHKNDELAIPRNVPFALQSAALPK